MFDSNIFTQRFFTVWVTGRTKYVRIYICMFCVYIHVPSWSTNIILCMTSESLCYIMMYYSQSRLSTSNIFCSSICCCLLPNLLPHIFLQHVIINKSHLWFEHLIALNHVSHTRKIPPPVRPRRALAVGISQHQTTPAALGRGSCGWQREAHLLWWYFHADYSFLPIYIFPRLSRLIYGPGVRPRHDTEIDSCDTIYDRWVLQKLLK